MKTNTGSRRCRVCNRPLTDSSSITKGIGPVCFKKGELHKLQMEFEFISEQEDPIISDKLSELQLIIDGISELKSIFDKNDDKMSYGENVRIELFTDGSTTPHRSGWGFVLRAIKNGEILKELEKSGEIPHTTNNRAEMQAVIEGLKILIYKSDVTVYSDSQYIVNSMTKNWKKNTNFDLWTELDNLCKKHIVKFKWISRDQNQQADALSR